MAKDFKKIKQTKGINEKLAIYRERSSSISSNKIKMIKYNWIVYNKELNFSKLKSFILLLILFSFMSKKDLKIKFY